jgi:hypothetical protein
MQKARPVSLRMLMTISSPGIRLMLTASTAAGSSPTNVREGSMAPMSFGVTSSQLCAST